MMTSCAVSPVCGCLSPNPGWSHLVSYSHSFRGSGELTGFGWQWAAGLWRAMELLANHRGDCLLASHFSTTPAWGVARFCCRASVSSAGERSNPMLCAHRSLSSSHVNNWDSDSLHGPAVVADFVQAVARRLCFVWATLPKEAEVRCDALQHLWWHGTYLAAESGCSRGLSQTGIVACTAPSL